jgi:hypothetical protein
MEEPELTVCMRYPWASHVKVGVAIIVLEVELGKVLFEEVILVVLVEILSEELDVEDMRDEELLL